MKMIKRLSGPDRSSLYREAYEIKSEIENGGLKEKMSAIYKKIAEGFENEYDEKYTKYISLYITLQTIYKSFHWLTRGTGYYGDHLLFDRLYDSLTEEIDFLAEKLISLFGRECVNPINSTKIVYTNLETIIGGFDVNCDPSELVAIALYFEILFLEINNEFYKMLQEGEKTMGLDDLIMSNHSAHENNLYLLKSRFSVESLAEKNGVENERVD